MRAIIMAGGKGTRLYPLTRDIPKPLVKIIDKPVMEHIIELLKQHGITEIGVTLGHMADSIIRYFKDGSKYGVKLTYFVETQPLGTVGGIKVAQNYLSEDFLVISGDSYTNINLSELIHFHLSNKSPLTVVSKKVENPLGLGVMEVDENNVITSFVEKPNKIKPSLINCGIYAINKKVLAFVPEEGPYDFGRQLLPSLVGSIYSYETDGYWSDIGTLPSYYYTNYLVATNFSSKNIIQS